MKLNSAVRWLGWFRKAARVNTALVIPESVISALAAIPGVLEVRVREMSEGLDITVASIDWFAVRRRVHWWTQDNNQNVKVGWWLEPGIPSCGAYDRMDQVISSLGYRRPGKGWKTDAGANHLSRVGVSELVGHEASGEAERVTHLVQVVAELAHERVLGGWASQQETIGGQRIEGTKEAQALNEFTNETIDRDHTFCLQFAERDMYGPLIRAGGSEAIVRQIGALADAHAGVTDQKKRVASEIIATEELLVEELVLLSGERAWQPFGEARNVLGADQMSEFRKGLGARELLEDRAQMNEQVDTGCGGQGRRLRAEARHPAEDVWIAAQLIKSAYLGMSGAEVTQKLANGPAVVTSRLRVQRGAEGIDGTVEDRRQRMNERRASWTVHNEVTGSGRMCWATARAYCR